MRMRMCGVEHVVSPANARSVCMLRCEFESLAVEDLQTAGAPLSQSSSPPCLSAPNKELASRRSATDAVLRTCAV